MIEETIRGKIEAHKKLVSFFENNSIEILTMISQLIAETFNNKGCLYLCGNGGSAADAQHVAGEFVGRFLKDRRALPAISLSTDSSVLTCIGNDYSYKEIFSRQLEALAKPGDILWVLSTSGNSENIIAAIETARTKSMKIIAFTGKVKSKIETLSDITLCASTNETSHAQEIHQLAYHIICGLVENLICPS
jgi:D-sedoheptulose 7-phosphate isomerase